MLFSACSFDNKALSALELLGRGGYATRVLASGESAPADSVALFTPLCDTFQGSRGKFLRCSAIRLPDSLTPEWARTTKMRVAIIRTEKEGRRRRHVQPVSRTRGFETAVLNMAGRYKSWLKEGSGIVAPWLSSPNDKSMSAGSQCGIQLQEWLACPDVSRFRSLHVIKRPAGSDIRTVPVAGWQVNVSNQVKIFPASAAQQALAMLGQWSSCFPQEQTWVRRTHGLPSMLVRFDCVVIDGRLIVYEIEERPAGIGISGMVNSDFREHFKRLAQTWRPFRVEVSPLRRATDDPLWISDLGWDDGRVLDSELVLVRAEPEESEFFRFEPGSVSTLRAKGDKSYGETMGLWRRVSTPDHLNWGRSFVLKPLQGSKLKDLQIWDPARRPGSSIQTVVEEALRKNGSMFMQELFSPMESGLRQFPWMIYRMFFGYNATNNTWEALGGNWNARHNLRIHGASDAVFGPAVVG